MKKLVFGVVMALVFTGCNVYVEEEPVPYDVRDRFVGTYEIEEYSELLDAISYFNVRISKDYYDDYVIYLDNFYGSGFEVYAEVTGNKIRIPFQRVGFYEIEGYGSIYQGELSLTYSVEDIDSYYDSYDYCESIGYRY